MTRRYHVIQQLKGFENVIVSQYDDRWAALRTCDLFKMEEIRTQGDAHYYVYDTQDKKVIKND